MRRPLEIRAVDRKGAFVIMKRALYEEKKGWLLSLVGYECVIEAGAFLPVKK